MNIDEELFNQIFKDNLKKIQYRSKSFLFRTHNKYTIHNLVPDKLPRFRPEYDSESNQSVVKVGRFGREKSIKKQRGSSIKRKNKAPPFSADQ